MPRTRVLGNAARVRGWPRTHVAGGASGVTAAASRPLTSPNLTSHLIARDDAAASAGRPRFPPTRPPRPGGVRSIRNPRTSPSPNHGPSRCSHQPEPRPPRSVPPVRAAPRQPPPRPPPVRLQEEASSRLRSLVQRRRRARNGQGSCPMAEEGEGAGRGAGLEDPVPPHPPSRAATQSGLRAAGQWVPSGIWLSAPIRDLPDYAHPQTGNLSKFLYCC